MKNNLPLFCLAILLAVSAQAALIDRADALARAATVTPEAYPDADTVLVYDHTQEWYRPDGTGARTNEWYQKVLTEKGRREARTASFWMNVSYGGVTVETAERIRPDGTSHPIDVAANSRLMTEPGQMDSNIYDPANKILTVAFPGLDVGDVLRLVVVRTTTKARVPDAFSTYALFEYTSPILALTHVIDAPAARPLQTLRVRDETAGGVAYAAEPLPDGGTRHRWRVTDVPRAFPEPDMPALHTCAQRLLASTLPDWESLSRWYWHLSEPRMAATVPAMQETVDALVDGATSRDARIWRLFTYVSQRIRYMGVTPEDEAPGYEPHDVSLTFENQYGVCRDKAALLVVMLRMAGIEAFPVLIHVGERRDPEVPQLYFNHAIVAVTSACPDATGADRYMLMDPTNENTARLLPEYLCEKSFLVARPEGETLLESPALPAEENLLVIETTGTLTGGWLRARSRITPRGVNDTMYRSGFSRMRRDDRRRHVERMLQHALPGAVLTDLTIEPEDLQQTDVPLVLTCAYAVPGGVLRGRVDVALLPQLAGVFGMVNFKVRSTGLETRRFPLQTEVPCGVEERITLRTDFAERPFFGDGTVEIDVDGVHYLQSVACTGGVIEASSRLLLGKSLYAPDAYRILRAALQQVETARQALPIWTGAAPAGADTSGAPEAVLPETPDDIHVLLEETVIEPAPDGGGWTEITRVRKHIRTYAGKVRGGDVRFFHNPAMEEVTLSGATVTRPDGSVREVSELEQNIMDQPWVAAAPRYPEGRVLVVNFPGLDVGSVVDYTVRRRVFGAPVQALTKRFGGVDAVDVQRLVVKPTGGSAFTVQGPAPTASRLHVEREADGTTVIEARDWPAPLREDNLPPARHRLPDAWHLGEALDVFAYADRLSTAMDARVRGQPAAAARARALVEGLDTPPDRVRAIRDFVARNIRNAGPAFFELPLDALSPADITLAAGYGHGADTAILLKAMLAAVDLEARWVWIDSDRLPGDPDAPCVEGRGVFDTVLVAVDAGDATYYLNDGSQYAELQATAMEGRLMADRETRTWRPLVPDPGYATGVSNTYDLDIQPDGTAWVTVETTYTGAAVEAFRRRYEEITPEARRRHVLEVLSAFSRRAELAGVYETDTRAYPARRRVDMRIPDWAVWTDEFLNVRLINAATTAVAPRQGRRVLPFYRDAPHVLDDTWRVRLPAGRSELMLQPGEMDFDRADAATVLRVVCAAERRDGRLTVTVRRRTELGRALMRPETYADYTDAALAVQGRAGDTLLVRRCDSTLLKSHSW